MNSNRLYPVLYKRLFSVWFRHVRVYVSNLFSNAAPPFIEPLLFMTGIGLGLGKYITQSMEGLSYIAFLGTGLLVTTAMFTAAFECTFGAFFRLEYEKVYDGMLAASINVRDLVIGEVLWVGTKGVFFTFAVVCILSSFGILKLPLSLLAPIVGFFTAVMFGSLSLFVTSFVRTVNHYNFFFTGFISPMFFFSGVVFPTSNLPQWVQPIVELLPLTHAVRLARAACTNQYSLRHLWDVCYVTAFIFIFTSLAIWGLRKRLIN